MFQLTKARQCPFYYVAASSFTCLFRCGCPFPQELFSWLLYLLKNYNCRKFVYVNNCVKLLLIVVFVKIGSRWNTVANMLIIACQWLSRLSLLIHWMEAFSVWPSEVISFCFYLLSLTGSSGVCERCSCCFDVIDWLNFFTIPPERQVSAVHNRFSPFFLQPQVVWGKFLNIYHLIVVIVGIF